MTSKHLIDFVIVNIVCMFIFLGKLIGFSMGDGE